METDKSYEELRAAYLSRVLKIEYGPTLTAIRAWNRMKTPEKIRRATKAPAARARGTAA